MECERVGLQHDVQHFAAELVKPLLGILRQRLRQMQRARGICHEAFDRAHEQGRLVGITRINEALGDARLARDFFDRDAIPTFLQEQAKGRSQQAAVPSLRLVPGRPPARTALELAMFQWRIGHSFVPLPLCGHNANATIPFGYIRSSAVNRRVIAILTVILLAAAGTSWWWMTRVAPLLKWQGYAEADFIKVGPTQQGLLTSLYVARGSRVAAGAPLFDQDDTSDRAAHDPAARQLHPAEDQLATLRAGGKPTEIQQAEANLADAYAARAKLQSDPKRHDELVKNGGVSRQLVEDQRADLRSALARVQGLEAALGQMRAPMGREGEIKAQQQLAQSSRDAAVLAPRRTDHRHVLAPSARRCA